MIYSCGDLDCVSLSGFSSSNDEDSYFTWLSLTVYSVRIAGEMITGKLSQDWDDFDLRTSILV